MTVYHETIRRKMSQIASASAKSFLTMYPCFSMLIFMEDKATNLVFSNFYADDTKICRSVKKYEDIEILQNDVNNLLS